MVFDTTLVKSGKPAELTNNEGSDDDEVNLVFPEDVYGKSKGSSLTYCLYAAIVIIELIILLSTI
ncbi:hypothetical protein STAT_249 [Blattabacterium cuenoti STAT]|uniref:Uncharacterized protein n=1 Tax=Blattabacterium cuenoti STAT TaxID=1457030 RepID=A0A224AII2_9FLAO|nr:hypothetical protein STAT_249 [Blattabacterium cuenoti STAT]